MRAHIHIEPQTNTQNNYVYAMFDILVCVQKDDINFYIKMYVFEKFEQSDNSKVYRVFVLNHRSLCSLCKHW